MQKMLSLRHQELEEWEDAVVAVRKQVSEKSRESEEAREQRRILGRILKTWRENKGLTQADLAEALNLKYYSFISQVENGLGRIPQSLYVPWANALSVDTEAFCWCVLAHVEPSIYEALSIHDKTSVEGWSKQPSRDDR